MNIQLLHTHIQQNCGISTYVKTLAHALPTYGHEVTVAGNDTAEARDFLGPAVAFHGLALDQYRQNPVSFGRALRQLTRLLRHDHVDVVVSSHRWASFVAYFAARLSGARLVSVCHLPVTGNRFFTIWGDHVIAISASNKRYLQTYFKVAPERISVIPNATREIQPASAEAQAAIRAEFDLDASHAMLINVGRLHEQKGQVYLLRAFAQVVETFPQARLLIVGGGPLAAALRAEVGRLGLENHVTLTGVRRDVPALLTTADLFVLPSLHEGMPFAMLEAMWLGLPVIATEVDGVPEVLNYSDPPCGRLVAPGDVASLADAIKATLQDPAAASAMGQRGQEVVRRYFSAQRMVAATEEVLRGVVAPQLSPKEAHQLER